MTFRIPAKVKIGGVEYAVEWVKDLRDSRGERCWGMWSIAGPISIDAALKACPGEAADTLLHEVTHILRYQLKLDLSEETVCRLSRGLTAFLADNKVVT